MAKRIVLFLMVAAVALTAFSLALSRRDSRDWRANRSRRVFPFPWQDTVFFSIRTPDGQVREFSKDPGMDWTIVLDDGVRDTLSNFAVDELSALATLCWREPLPGAAPPDPAHSTLITATSASGQVLHLLLGKPSQTMRPAIINDDTDIVYGVRQEYLRFLDWPLERFRKFTLANAGTGSRPNKIVLAPPGNDPHTRLVLEQDADGWQVRSPVVWPADPARMEALLRWVDRLRADAIAVEQTNDPKQYGFTPDSAYVETSFPSPAGPLHRRVEFGLPAEGGGLYARVVSRPPVFIISRSALAEISLDIGQDQPEVWKNLYRRSSIDLLGDAPFSGITIEQLLPEPKSLTIEPHGERDGWLGLFRGEEGERVFPVDPPDRRDPARPLTALAERLKKINIQEFVADIAPGPETAKWTAFPAWRLAIAGPDGKPRHVLTLYAPGSDGDVTPDSGEGSEGDPDMQSRPGEPEGGVLFTLDNQPAILKMAVGTAEFLSKPLYMYQSRRLLDSDPLVWSRVEIEAGGNRTVYTRDPAEINEQWWRGVDGSEPLMDDNNIFVNLLVELSQLRSEGYVYGANDLPEKFGLDQPEITAIVYVSPGSAGDEGTDEILFTLEVGGTGETETEARYARLDGTGPVFLLSRHLAEALLRDYR